MSQFPSAPPPGPYVPPSSSQPSPGPYNQQQQGQYYQQPQTTSPYQAPYSSSHTQSPHQSSSTSSSPFGQIFNQAVTTGKPVWDKFNKTVSSKLNKSSKTSTPTTASNLEGYQQYQGHHQQQQQQQQQQQPQQYNTQPPPGQWQSSTYSTPQQSPYPPSNYTSPPPGPNNYFPPQQPTHSPSSSQQLQQHPPFPQNTQNYNQYGASEQIIGADSVSGIQQQQGQAPPQQYHDQNHAQQPVGQPYSQDPTTSPPPLCAPNSAPLNANDQFQQQQQQHQWSPQNAPPSNNIYDQSQEQQQQWTQQNNAPTNVPPSHQSSVPPTPQHSHTFNPTPPPQPYTSPPPPNNPNQPQQWTPGPPPMSPTDQSASYHSSVPSFNATEQQNQPIGSPHNAPIQQAFVPPPQSNPTTPHPPSSAAPTEFIAELPADLGNLNLGGPQPRHKPNPSQSPSQQYQAYQPPSQAQSPNATQAQPFKVPRKSVSISSAFAPLNDPWRIADPGTEQPTREFLIIADLLFDALDSKCEPKNSGFLEASNILESWKVQGIANDTAQLFSHNYFRAFASLWTLEGIPHFLLPNTPTLIPSFDAQPNPQTLKITPELPTPNSTYPQYIPALNRAGWYKYLFLELLGEPESLDKLLSTFCADTYNPNSPSHPDLARRDKGEPQSLSARANRIRTEAIARVCQETAGSMNGAGGLSTTAPGGPGAPAGNVYGTRY